MYYKKLNLEGLIIEFHNNWLGEETIVVNGQTVSKKSSIMGTDHHFSVLENGSLARYVLTTKIDSSMAVYLDLCKNRNLILEDILVPMTSKSAPLTHYKSTGLQKLKEYKIDEAIEDLNKALDKTPSDPELYFHLACAYSILERAKEGLDALQKAIEYNLNNRDMILSHDMLAYLRMHETFEAFYHSNYTVYDKNKIK